MIGLCIGYSLEELKELRPAKDCSFQGNLGRIFAWFNHGRIMSRDATDGHLLGVVRLMLNINAADRPTASEVERHFAMIGGIRRNSSPTSFRGTYYSPTLTDRSTVGARTLGLADNIGHPFETALIISIGNAYRLEPPTLHRWVFFVRPSLTSIPSYALATRQ
jgi:hypothetical protein